MKKTEKSKKLFLHLIFSLFLVLFFIIAIFRASPSQADSLYIDVSGSKYKKILDIQAKNAYADGILDRFEPNCTETIIFAVNKDKTDFVPHKWNDLLNIPEVVSIADDNLQKTCITSSIAYALEGNDYSNDCAFEFMKKLAISNRLKIQDTPLPISICFDSDAKYRIRNGENLEIIVPEDGTLSFEVEVSSKIDNSLVPKDVLESMNYVLPEKLNIIYPSAHKITDVDHFLKETDALTKNIRRKVFNTNKFTSSYGVEHYFFSLFLILIIIIWTAAAINKSAQKFTRNCIISISVICICLLLTSMLKFNIDHPFLNRLLWYCYYIFFIALPLSLLYISLYIDEIRSSHFSYKKMAPVFLCYPFFVVLVLTNDLHNIVFKIINPNSSEYTYTHNWGYYIIFAYCIIIFLLALFILIYKSRKSPKRYYKLYPILLSVFIIIFLVAYLLKLPFFKTCNLSRTLCLFVMIFMETVLHSGLIPINTHYKDLFLHIGRDIKIVDDNNNVFLSTISESNIDENSNNVISHIHKIHGGNVIWKEDITNLNVLHKKIENSIKQIEKANHLLMLEKNQQELLVSTSFKQELLNSLENDMKTESDELKEEIKLLKDNDNKFEHLSYITFLLCHIKRKCNMFFLFAQNRNISATDLLVYIDELSEFSNSETLKTIVRCDITNEINIHQAIIIYDFYFILLKFFRKFESSTLIGNLTWKHKSIIFNFIVSNPVDKSIFSNEFISKLLLYKGTLNIKRIDDMDVIEISFLTEKDGDI